MSIVVVFFFFCSTGLPLVVLLLYWAGLYWVGLTPAVLGQNVLSKGVEIDPTGTQLGPACVQTISRLPRAYLRQAKLFRMGYDKQT